MQNNIVYSFSSPISRPPKSFNTFISISPTHTSSPLRRNDDISRSCVILHVTNGYIYCRTRVLRSSLRWLKSELLWLKENLIVKSSVFGRTMAGSIEAISPLFLNDWAFVILTRHLIRLNLMIERNNWIALLTKLSMQCLFMSICLSNFGQKRWRPLSTLGIYFHTRRLAIKLRMNAIMLRRYQI